MMNFKAYIKQDGVYNTLEILISDISLPDTRDWYQYHLKHHKLKDLLFDIYKGFMIGFPDVDHIRMIDSQLGDEIIITLDMIKELNPHLFIYLGIR